MYALLKILHSAPGGERCNISKMYYLLFILLNCLAISTNTSFTLTKLNLETGKKKGEGVRYKTVYYGTYHQYTFMISEQSPDGTKQKIIYLQKVLELSLFSI